MRRAAVCQLLAFALVLTACATPPPVGGNRYGLTWEDSQEAIKRGEGPQALAYYERAAAFYEARGDVVEAGRAHRNVAAVHASAGWHQRALQAARRAVALYKQAPPHPDIDVLLLEAYAYAGESYLWAGSVAEAERAFEEALQVARRQVDLALMQSRTGQFLEYLAQVAQRRGDLTAVLRYGVEADVRYEELERLIAGNPARYSRDYVRFWRRRIAHNRLLMADAHRLSGRLADAERISRGALAIAREIGDQLPEARALVLLGWLALQRTRSDEALPLFEQAAVLYTRLRNTSPLMFAYSGVGWANFWLRRYEPALTAFERSMTLMEDIRDRLQTLALRGGFLDDKQGIYFGAVRTAIAAGRVEDAFAFAERARARALLDLLGTRTSLAKSGSGARESGELTVATEYPALLERVRRESPEQASLMTVEPITVADVQRLLPAGTTLVTYLVQDTMVIWVVDRERVRAVEVPLDRKTLVALVQAFRDAITTLAPVESVRTSGGRLYEHLITPIRDGLRGDRLLIVPHDVLHYVPFPALRSPEGRWLVEDYTLATLPSASVMKFLGDKEAAAAAGALVVGNPGTGAASRLPFAEREAYAVGERFPGATVLVREAATEGRVKARIGTAGLLHFATHAELREDDPLSSALLLVPDSAEDGRLEVREIFRLDLKARLVVLSACDTGLGRLSRGDELVGLQRAFLYAGTPAVVTTLWKVDDRASFVLMREFYDHLATRGPAIALQRAQLATLTAFPHPYGWAAFSLTAIPR